MFVLLELTNELQEPLPGGRQLVPGVGQCLASVVKLAAHHEREDVEQAGFEGRPLGLAAQYGARSVGWEVAFEKTERQGEKPISATLAGQRRPGAGADQRSKQG